jgi:hypothetical protein
MSNALLTTKFKNAAVGLIGLMTFLWGVAYAAEGVYFLLVWADFLPGQDKDLADRIVIIRGPSFLAPLGVLFVAMGFMGLTASLGLFARKAWGRALTLFVALSAYSSGLLLHDAVPPISGAYDTMDIGRDIAQVLYGVLAIAFLSANRGEQVGIYILRLLSLLVALPFVYFWGSWLQEFTHELYRPNGQSSGDLGRRFAALSFLSGLVASVLTAATGVVLLFLRKKRFMPAVALMIAACGTAAAQAAFALLGALMGHSRGGLLEGFLLVFFLPLSLVLLFLAATGVWYLRRPNVRLKLEAKRKPQS